MKSAILVFGYGNLSRGDDALAPLLLAHLETNTRFSAVEILSDFQLQIEHALDLEQRELVLFVDASVKPEQPVGLCRLSAAKDKTYTTHAMSPESVLQVYQDIHHREPPPCFLLTMQGLSFELGESVSEQAQLHLQQGIALAESLLAQPTLAFWQQQSAGYA